MFLCKARSLSWEVGPPKVPRLIENINLECKWLEMTNTLAYYSTVFITAEKSCWPLKTFFGVNFH